MTGLSVQLASSDEDIERCYATMAELRPQVARCDFLRRVRAQIDAGYRLAALRAGDEVVAVAGYRVTENLHLGRFLYVDDLVTAEARRSQGAGRQLFDWLVAEARASGCRKLILDSGVQRTRAHRFYFSLGMYIEAYHFGLDLESPAGPDRRLTGGRTVSSTSIETSG